MGEELNIPSDLILIIRNMYIASKGIIEDKHTGEFYEFLSNIGVK